VQKHRRDENMNYRHDAQRYLKRSEVELGTGDDERLKYAALELRSQELWNDIDLLEIPAKTTDEPRFLIIGRIGKKHWTGVITYRNDKIRIISVRRARIEEVELYES
jgi:uncharacterized protein